MFWDWTEVFVTLNDKEYYKAKGKLNDAGIKSKSKIESPNNMSTHTMGMKVISLYKIKVRNEDVSKAQRVIRR